MRVHCAKYTQCIHVSSRKLKTTKGHSYQKIQTAPTYPFLKVQLYIAINVKIYTVTNNDNRTKETHTHRDLHVFEQGMSPAKTYMYLSRGCRQQRLTCTWAEYVASKDLHVHMYLSRGCRQQRLTCTWAGDVASKDLHAGDVASKDMYFSWGCRQQRLTCTWAGDVASKDMYFSWGCRQQRLTCTCTSVAHLYYIRGHAVPLLKLTWTKSFLPMAAAAVWLWRHVPSMSSKSILQHNTLCLVWSYRGFQ